MKTLVKIRTVVTSVCVKNKEHLLLGSAYGVSTVWHHSAILTVAYGVVALAGVHIFRHRDRTKKRDTQHVVYHGRHLAD
jgi:hypothetical protein